MFFLISENPQVVEERIILLLSMKKTTKFVKLLAPRRGLLTLSNISLINPFHSLVSRLNDPYSLSPTILKLYLKFNLAAI